MDEQKKKEKLSVGVAILILLSALTLGEFWIGAVAHVWWAPLLGVAALKAFFVVRDYMHIGRVFAGDEESH